MVLRVDRGRAGPVSAREAVEATVPAAETGQLVLFEGAGEDSAACGAPAARARHRVPAPPLYRLSRLSYSAISLFDRCSYRSTRSESPACGPGPGRRSGTTACRPACTRRRRGTLCTGCSSGSISTTPTSARRAGRARPLLVPDGRGPELERIDDSSGRTAIRSSHAGSPRCPACARSGLPVRARRRARERASRRPLAERRRALVLDYKTNASTAASLPRSSNRGYAAQRSVYALACLRAGAEEVEVVYQFLEAPERGRLARRSRPRTSEALEASCPASITRIREGDFRPTPSPFACSGCPALDRRVRRSEARRRTVTRSLPIRPVGAVASSRAGRGALRHPWQPPRARGGPGRCSTRTAPTRSSSAATCLWGPLQTECVELPSRLGATFCVRGNCERDVLRPTDGPSTAGAPIGSARPPRHRRGAGRRSSSWTSTGSDPCSSATRRRGRRRDRLHAHHPRRGASSTSSAPVAADVLVCGHTHVQFDRALTGSPRSSMPAAWACRTRARQAPSGRCSAPDVELRRAAVRRRGGRSRPSR